MDYSTNSASEKSREYAVSRDDESNTERLADGMLLSFLDAGFNTSLEY